MNRHQLAQVAAVLSSMEARLQEGMDLEAAARTACCSKYHLHRLFTAAAGITPHSYLRRRQLTEAARRLVFSETPILEIALTSGFESQQSFTSAFKDMYKRTPLQTALVLDDCPPPACRIHWESPACANLSDLPGWMRLMDAAAGGFPCLDREQHLRRLRCHIQKRQVLVLRDGASITGGIAFSRGTGCIELLAVRPQYRNTAAARLLLDALRRELGPEQALSITTFRQGDRADPGQRAVYRRLGFLEAELTTEFGYPVQRLLLPPSGDWEHRHG